MGNFTGFYKETADMLMGIRMNNNKTWFDEHKDHYKMYVHEPITLLGEELYTRMKAFDADFDAAPKVSRVNRDIRFSKEKTPYRENKWVMLQAAHKGGANPEDPEYFFEVSPEGYRYGFGYWPKPKGMAAFRAKIDANPAEAERLIARFKGQKTFKLEAELYKRRLSGAHSELVSEWYQCRYFTFVCYRDHDALFVQRELLNVVAEGFELLYPLYRYFKSIETKS